MDNELLDVARVAIAAEFGLGAAQARRLRGETAAELRADAKAMRAELGLEPVDERERDQQGRYASGERDMNSVIREAAGR